MSRKLAKLKIPIGNINWNGTEKRTISLTTVNIFFQRLAGTSKILTTCNKPNTYIPHTITSV